MNLIINPQSMAVAIALAGLASATFPASGGLVQTKVFSATELAYSADVSTTDLLAGKTASSVGSWNLTNGSTVAELNDGIHGGSGTPVEGTWTTVGATATYNLGLGANNLGYDITSIQSIAAWFGAGFGNQAYTVDVKLVGAASYTNLATVDYQPLGSAVGATKVTLTDTTGVLETGVEFIRFTATSVNGGANSGAFVFREIDVFGTSSTTSNIGRLTLKSTGSSPTPAIIGYNHGYFTNGGNARAWWEYAGVNGVRIFIDPSQTEPTDDLAPWGDSVSSDATFENRKTALRADPLNNAYINWSYFTGKLDDRAYALGQYRDMGMQIMVQCTAVESILPITSSTDYAGRWELWQHYYASAFYYARYFDVTRYQMFNEPDHPDAGGITTTEWLLRLQLASDAIRSAISDVNSRYGKSLQPIVAAPTTSSQTYSPWGNTAVDNRHRNYRGTEASTIWNMHRYAYHQYNSTASNAYQTAISLQSSIAADMTGETPFPLCLSEFNVHTASNFDSMPDTLDYPAKYARFGAIVCELAKSGLDEMFCFKFAQTDFANIYGVKKNGMHYVDNDNSPNNHGGVTKAGEVYRLFNKGLAPGRVMKDYTRASDGSIDALDLRASYDAVSKKYFLFSVNESSNSIPISVDTSAWNIPTNNRVLLEEVSENRHGSGRVLGSVTADKTLFDGTVNLWQQPANTVWLWTIPSKAQQAEETVAVAEDTMVKDGSNAGINYGSATTLLVRNNPTNNANRSTAFLKFNLPPIYLPDIQIATLCLRTRATPSGTAQGYIYGIDNNTWSENTLTWTNAPNLKKSKAAGNKIANRVIDGEGTTAHILGQLVAASTTASERIIDVTDYLRSQPNRVPSFLITQDPRWDVALPSLAVGDTQPGGLEITSSEGSTDPYLRIVRLKDTDGDGISDEAEIGTFSTKSNDADSDNDGLSDGNEVLVLLTNPNLNNIPTISNITNRSIVVNANTGAIAVTIGDVETATTSLTLTRSSSNPSLIPLSGIVLGGSGANRTVTVTPAANQIGSSTITVTVSDGVLTASDTFLVTVTATASELWRIANFGTAANSGTAADTFDANNDGEINLLEYATAQNPYANSLAVVTAIRTANALEVTYTRSKAAFTGGVTFTVEWSDTLAANSWSATGVTQTVLTDNGTIQTIKATVPASPSIPKRYARLKVTQLP
jgi:Bacterial TSP3 repeat